MDKITPLDIQKQNFHIRFRGFDMKEVNTFLDLISDEMVKQILLNQQFNENIKRKEKEIQEHRKREAILKQAMITAQKTINEMRANAEKEAKLIVSEAQIEADKIMQDARRRASQLLVEIDDLKKQRMHFEAALRSEIEMHKKMLDARTKKEEQMAPLDHKLMFMKKKN